MGLFWETTEFMTIIRKVRTASRAMVVYIKYKQNDKVVQLQHLGNAHKNEELDILVAQGLSY